MDKDTDIDEEVKEDALEGNEEVGWHGVGRSPEHETLLGIYQCAYSTDTAVRKIANFVDRVDWYLELLYYGIIGALIGWAVAKILMVLNLF